MERFTALQDFWSEEVKSQYAKGLAYTIRPGNRKLHDLVHGAGDKPGWLAEGKVALGAAAAGVAAAPAAVAGTARVRAKKKES